MSAAEAVEPEVTMCCKRPTTFDPDIAGLTCGGLWLRGWDMCAKCGKGWLSERATVCDAPVWRIAGGGRSVDIGTGRIRFGAIKVESGEKLDVVSLMARVAKLPELEREVAHLRAKAAELHELLSTDGCWECVSLEDFLAKP